MLVIGSDKYIFIENLYDELNEAYVNDATVTGALLDADDESSIGTFSLTYETASNGKYEGIIAASVTSTLTDLKEYLIKITATSSGATTLFQERLVAVDIKGDWLRWNSHYLKDLPTLTEVQKNQVTTIIKGNQVAIQQYCNRKFNQQELDEVKRADQFSRYFLDFPVVKISRFLTEQYQGITIQNTSAQTSSVAVTSTGISLVHITSGTRTNTTLLFSDYATLTLMAAAVTAVGSGWSASVTDSTYNAYPSSDLVEGQAATCASENYLYFWKESALQFEVNNDTGVVSTGVWKHSPARFIYTVGWATDDVPEDLKMVLAFMVVDAFNGSMGTIKSEKIGDYSYSLDSATDQIQKLPVSHRAILDSYRDRAI
jgi:hypothetical protein